MTARTMPEDGDIVIRSEMKNGHAGFVLHVAPGPDQFRVRSEDEAVARATRTARREHVRVWITDGDFAFRMLSDFRVPAAERLRAEFLEMPGLRLTLRQAERLCGINARACKAILDALVEAKFLALRADGTYGRASDGKTASTPRPNAPARDSRRR